MKSLLFCIAALVVLGISVSTMTSARQLSLAETDQIYGAGSNCPTQTREDGCVDPCAVQSSYKFVGNSGHSKENEEEDCEYTVYPPGEDPVNKNCGSYKSAIFCG